MGRQFVIECLSPAEQIQVDQCIRLHGYRHIDQIMESVLLLKIPKLSRSALGRYTKRLREKEEMCAQPNEETIITIVERGTGEVRMIKSCASGQVLAAMIEKINKPPNIS